MPSVAFARPMWPAMLRALRELTRLALATLVLAVGLGGAAASGLPDRPVADLGTRPLTAELPARPIADLATRPLTAELPARPIAMTVAAHPAVKAIRAADERPARQVQALAPAAPPAQPEHIDATPGPAVAILAHPLAAPRPGIGHGEPTRRGPPTA